MYCSRSSWLFLELYSIKIDKLILYQKNLKLLSTFMLNDFIRGCSLGKIVINTLTNLHAY